MNDDSKAMDRYRRLRGQRPDLFADDGSEYCIVIDDSPDGLRRATRGGRDRVAAMGLDPAFADPGLWYESEAFQVLRDPVIFPGGGGGTYLRVVMRDPSVPGTSALPVFDGMIILLRQFRHSTRSWHWEIPRGFGTAGLSPEENMIKELKEEIDAEVKRLVPLGELHTSTGLSDERGLMYLAELASVGAVDAAEGIAAMRPVDKPTFERMLATGEITDSFTLASYARAVVRGLL